MKFIHILLIASTIAVTGCGGTHVISGLFHPSPAISTPQTPSTALNPSISKHPPTFQETANGIGWTLWIVGILSILAGGAMIYLQNYFLGGKLIVAGVILPVIGHFVSVYYAEILFCAILVSVLVFFIHYKAVLLPYFKELEAKVQPKPVSPTLPVPTT